MKQWLGMAVLLVAWRAETAEACQCGDLNEPAALENADVVFDGWVVSAPHPWKCAVPPAPKVKAGCVRITVVDSKSCEPYAALVGLDGVTNTVPKMDDDKATTLCGVKTGKYVARVNDTWGGDEDGTVSFGRTLDVVPGSSYVLFGSSGRGQELTVGVTRAIKGNVPREVKVKGTHECCVPFFRVGGSAQRFFATKQPDGTLTINTSRDLTDAERNELVTVPAPVKAEPPPAPAKSKGCSTTGAPSSLWLTVLALVMLRRRKKRMRILNALVVVALLTGCKKTEEKNAAPAAGSGSAVAPVAAPAPADPGPPASCKDAATNYAKVTAADPSTDLGKAETGIQGLMKYSYEEACDTEWSEANKSCAAKATTSAAARACFDAKMVERLDLITKAEIEDMLKNKAANEAAKAAGSGSAAP